MVKKRKCFACMLFKRFHKLLHLHCFFMTSMHEMFAFTRTPTRASTCSRATTPHFVCVCVCVCVCVTPLQRPSLLRHRPWRNFCCDVRGERLCHSDLVGAMGRQLAESPWFKRRVRAQRYPVPTRISTHVRSVATSVLARRKTSPSV